MNQLPPSNAIELIQNYLHQLQADLCSRLEALDEEGLFRADPWEHRSGGGGLTKVLTHGKVFEKAAVNCSQVSGKQLPPSATTQRIELADRSFHALGLSLIIHPLNPYVPTAHANVRFFIAEKKGAPPLWWFGGGFDLTPYYGFEEDCRHWHQTAFQACEPFGPELYSKFKQNCDLYFFIKHRQEARGIGGLFFDDYNEVSFEHSFSLMQSIGNHFIKAYEPIVARRKTQPFGMREKAFQKYRRGRYVEFNLVYDRGTLFGLQSEGRTESILLSLPPEVSWEYDWHPEKNSAESKLYTDFLPARDWL